MPPPGKTCPADASSISIVLILSYQQHVKDGSRAKFIGDCKSGVYDNVLAISRTFDSAQVRGSGART